MAPQSVETRVESLEVRVTRLEELPGRMDPIESQIVQLRTDMRDEFSAVRQEMRDEFSAVRHDMREGFAKAEAGDEQTRNYMRVLFEDYIDRLKTIDEGKGGA